MRLPDEVVELIRFLEEQGLTLYCRRGPDREFFGNMYIEYAAGTVKVQIVKDRSQWLIALADASQPDNWYDITLVRDLVLGKGTDPLPLPEEVKIIKMIWQPARESFSPSRRQATHARLAQIADDRAKRIFPSWSDAALDLEAFLSKEGLVCQHRDAPEGSFGDRLMEYFDSVIGVRVTCGGPQSSEGWRVAVADATCPDSWYDIALIRCTIEQTTDREMPYLRRFQFVQENWAQIKHFFCDSCRETTHARLKQLLAEERGQE